MRTTGLIAALAASTCIVAIAAPAQAQQTAFNIPAGSLKSALDAYGRQSGRPIIYKADEIRGIRSSGYRGSAAPEQALDAILSNTGFTARAGAGGSVAIVRGGSGGGSQEESSDIVVVGSRLGGSKGTAAPVRVLDRKQIDQSGATSVAQLLNTLPEVSVNNDGTVAGSFIGGTTTVQLRGLLLPMSSW